LGPALTTGALLTVMTTLSLPERAPSLTVSLSVYTPPAEKVTAVLVAVGSSNVTVPGPLALLQVYVNAPGGFGIPSSVAEPFKSALGVGAVWSGPALTAGSLLTVITTLSLPDKALSLAVSLSI